MIFLGKAAIFLGKFVGPAPIPALNGGRSRSRVAPTRKPPPGTPCGTRAPRRRSWRERKSLRIGEEDVLFRRKEDAMWLVV